MKKLLNRPEDLVSEMCAGMAMAHPELSWIPDYRIIKRSHLNENKVTLLSGGGSGHEPAHAGFVGTGMLDAAVCGDVFASPSQIQVYQALRATRSNKGTLMIIKNYSGDNMNFKNASHLAKEDGIDVDYVIVDDDMAVNDSLYTVGRRGVAGTVLVHKIAGAAAERGMSLPEVKRVAQKAIDNMASLGFAFTSCTVPAKGTPTFEILDDEMEYGVGIHGEPGIMREKVLSADVLAIRMMISLMKELNPKKNSEIALLINGFGGTPLQELYVFNNSVQKVMKNFPVKISRILVGNYMTSIDMAGASVTMLKLDSELKCLLSQPCDTPGLRINRWHEVKNPQPWDIPQEEPGDVSYQVETPLTSAIVDDGYIMTDNIIYLVDKMSECIIRNEVPFCELDSHAGDGDFGMSVAKGFRRLKESWKNLMQHTESIGSFLDASAMIIMEHCGGASGPIWGSAFRAAARFAGNKQRLDIQEFADMMQAAVKGIQTTGERSFGRGAVVGDKTLIDALVPCADTWSACAAKGMGFHEAFFEAAASAVKGAKDTEKIVARMGRAGAVGERSLGYPDAGAYALGVIFTELAESIRK